MDCQAEHTLRVSRLKVLLDYPLAKTVLADGGANIRCRAVNDRLNGATDFRRNRASEKG